MTPFSTHPTAESADNPPPDADAQPAQRGPRRRRRAAMCGALAVMALGLTLSSAPADAQVYSNGGASAYTKTQCDDNATMARFSSVENVFQEFTGQRVATQVRIRDARGWTPT